MKGGEKGRTEEGGVLSEGGWDGRVEGERARTTLKCTITLQSLRCEVTDPEDLPTNDELTVNVTVGLFNAEAGSIRIVTTPPLLIILIPAFAGFIILCVVIFIVLFAVFCRKAKQKDQRYDLLMMELERLESSVARECKLGKG